MLLTLTVAAATLWAPSSGLADPPPGRVVSNYEVANDYQLHRDCGYSVELPNDPGELLWLFCDTVITDDTPAQVKQTLFPFRFGTFAGQGPFTPGHVPGAISHLPSPPAAPTLPNNNQPSSFVPNPSGLQDIHGNACLTDNNGTPNDPSDDTIRYQPAWAGGITAGPDSQVTVMNGSTPMVIADPSELLFVVYVEACVVQLPEDEPDPIWGRYRLEPKRTKLAVYDPADNSIVATSTLWAVSSPTGMLPSHQHVFHPTFHGGYLYFYTAECTNVATFFGTCNGGDAHALRAPLNSIGTGSAYQYRTASGWSTNIANAVDIIPAASSGPFMVDVGDFTHLGKGYLLMEQYSFGGHYRLWQAATPAGPWTLEETGQMPCPIGTDQGCYHLWSHPELSTESNLIYSFYSIYTESHTNGFIELRSIGTVDDL